MKKMIILMYDDLNNLINKGEVVKRYYNPKNFFKRIDFYLINQKRPNIRKLKKMTGSAKIRFYYIRLTFYHKILLFFNLTYLSSYLQNIFKNIKQKNSSLIRCYNLNFQIFIAQILNKKYKIPYIISLHYDLANYLENKNFFISYILKKKIVQVLNKAYKILPVYKSATRFLTVNKLNNFKICYNFINSINVKIKPFKKNKFIHFICTNRQVSYKNPINIIKAIKKVPRAKLTLIGDGPLHNHLKDYVKLNKLSNKVFFIKRIDNSKYIKILKNFDVFINCSDINEFSKGMIEAISFGLPIISNYQSIKIAELSREFSLQNSNTPKGYRRSMLRIINNDLIRKKLCRQAKNVYLKKYETDNCEKEFEKIYKTILNKD